jgi:photosystem II stability/assembly factor-like uncharacterized protein
MKQKILLFTSVLILFLCNSKSAVSQWIQSGAGEPISGHTVNAIAVEGNTLIAGTDFTVYTSSNAGAIWNDDTMGLSGNHALSLAVSGSNIFAGGYFVTPHFSGVFKSSDAGANWIASNNGLPDTLPDINAFLVYESDVFIATAGLGIFLSRDNGSSWNAVNTGLSNDTVYAFAMTDTNTASPKIFASTTQGGLFISANNGTSWKIANSGLPTVDVLALASDGTNLYAGVDPGGVYTSTNNGSQWTAVNNGISSRIHCLVVSGSGVFAGADDGIYFSTNNGMLWQAASIGLPSSIIRSLAFADNNLWAGTSDSGIWECPISQIIAPSAVASTPVASPEIQSHPNPFSQSTTINFSSPESGVAEITIVNLLGTEVARIFSGELTVGEHSFVWSKPPGLPEGMYECVVRMNGSVKQVPMVLLR